MAASFIEFGRNATVLTDVDSNGAHTLILTLGTNNSNASYVELARNPIFATDVTAGVHTLKVIYV